MHTTITDWLKATYGVSQREAEVALLVAKGLSNLDVALSLFITEKTVKYHLTSIYKRMRLKTRTQLTVAIFMQERNVATIENVSEFPKQIDRNILPTGVI